MRSLYSTDSARGVPPAVVLALSLAGTFAPSLACSTATAPASDPAAGQDPDQDEREATPVSSIRVQAALDDALASSEIVAAAVVLEVSSGALLGAAEIGGPELEHPLLEAFPPGSTVKPLMTLGALDAGVITEDLRVPCHGEYVGEGGPLSCFAEHGELDIAGALASSCNVFAYEVGARLGPAAASALLEAHGFGAASGLRPGEGLGNLPQDGSLALAAGHGSIRATPLQVANAYRDLARSDSAHKHVVIAGMVAAVESPGGTATAALVPGLRVAAKTGTADLSTPGPTPTYDSWTVVLAPAKAPEFVVVVLTHGGGVARDSAAPLAGTILTALFPS